MPPTRLERLYEILCSPNTTSSPSEAQLAMISLLSEHKIFSLNNSQSLRAFGSAVLNDKLLGPLFHQRICPDTPSILREIAQLELRQRASDIIPSIVTPEPHADQQHATPPAEPCATLEKAEQITGRIDIEHPSASPPTIPSSSAPATPKSTVSESPSPSAPATPSASTSATPDSNNRTTPTMQTPCPTRRRRRRKRTTTTTTRNNVTITKTTTTTTVMEESIED